jgi:hypothetical protein
MGGRSAGCRNDSSTGERARPLIPDKARTRPASQNLLWAGRPSHRRRAKGAPVYHTAKERIMRKALAIVMAAVAGSTFAAAPDWQPIGENANGNRIFVDKASLKAAGDTTSVVFRTELKTPIDTLKGGITSMRSQMRVRCKDMTAAGVEVILFENEAKNQAFARNKASKIEYVKEPDGSSADMVVKHVCKK